MVARKKQSLMGPGYFRYRMIKDKAMSSDGEFSQDPPKKNSDNDEKTEEKEKEK